MNSGLSGFFVARASDFLEVIAVHPFDLVGNGAGNTDVVLDHQLGQAFPVNRDDALGKVLHKISRVSCEVAGGDEDTLGCMLPRQRTHKTLYIGTTDRVLPALSLNVKPIQPQPVLVDQPVDPFVILFLCDRRGFLARSSVSHGQQEIDDKLLELVRIHFADKI